MGVPRDSLITSANCHYWRYWKRHQFLSEGGRMAYAMSTHPNLPLTTPPKYCEYAGGPCDQSFENLRPTDGFAVYPSEPVFISDAVENAIKRVHQSLSGQAWITWRDLGIPGQIIFCGICKALRSTQRAIADVTTLNSNVLFEIGYALGLGVPVQPVRDKNYIKDELAFDELGMLDTFGYSPFQNSEDLVHEIISYQPQAIALQPSATNREQPLYWECPLDRRK